MKKKNSSKPHMTSDNSEMSERIYRQELEAYERALKAIFYSLASCVPFCICPYEYQSFPQVIALKNEVGNSDIDKFSKKLDD